MIAAMMIIVLGWLVISGVLAASLRLNRSRADRSAAVVDEPVRERAENRLFFEARPHHPDHPVNVRPGRTPAARR